MHQVHIHGGFFSGIGFRNRKHLALKPRPYNQVTAAPNTDRTFFSPLHSNFETMHFCHRSYQDINAEPLATSSTAFFAALLQNLRNAALQENSSEGKGPWGETRKRRCLWKYRNVMF
ncbi:hypothetical protein AVEN_16540-1 [Araneus ventricosus]|uniref:Uncharacterized protein n=1 Tax=Araneus ventricosus TaxID=182803 RepID=A0A4Y2CMJ3_ARAVE|nr:hypothetical protein AVEN_16540-1 [Araneus ventricosus]